MFKYLKVNRLSTFQQATFIISSVDSIRMITGATSALYLISHGLSVKHIIYLKSLQAIIILITDIPFGYIADKFNRWHIMLFASCISFIWLLITALSNNALWLYIGEIFNALSLSLANGTEESLIVETYKENHINEKVSNGLSIVNKYSFIGMSIASLLGSMFTSPNSNSNWLFASLCMLCICLYTVFYIKKQFGFNKIKKLNNKLSNLKSPTLKIKEDIKHKLIDFKQILNSKILISLFISSILINLFYQIIIQYWQIPFKHYSILNLSSNMFLSLVFFCEFIIQAHVKKIIHIYEKYSITILLGICLLSFIFTLFNIFDFPLYILGIIVILYFWLFRGLEIILNSKIHVKVSDNLRSTILSTKSFCVRSLIIILSPLVSLLMNENIIHGLSILGTLNLIAGILFFYLIFIKKANKI